MGLFWSGDARILEKNNGEKPLDFGVFRKVVTQMEPTPSITTGIRYFHAFFHYLAKSLRLTNAVCFLCLTARNKFQL